MFFDSVVKHLMALLQLLYFVNLLVIEMDQWGDKLSVEQMICALMQDGVSLP